MKFTRRLRREPGALAPVPQHGPWSPFEELARLRNELSRVMHAPFEDFLAPVASFFEGWTPAFDLYEEKDRFTVKAEIPGMKKEDIDVSLNGNTLTISGERKQEEEHKESDVYRSERYFGKFQRTVTLPQPVDAGKVSANYKDGVLNITLPKTEETRRKQIEVKIS